VAAAAAAAAEAMEARDRSRSPRTLTDNTEEIVRLVATREQARLQKDWSLADTLRTQLSTMGVTLFDKTASWRSACGKSGRIPTFAELDGGNLETVIAQQAMEIQSQQVSNALLSGMDPMMTNFSSDAETQIKALVQQREQARANKDFARSDEIREELKTLGVEVFDKEKMWRSASGASGVIIGFHARGGPTDLEITTLVVQREKVRQAGDFGTSDMIRNELRTVGVEIYDKEKMWKATDGRQGPVPTWQQIQAVIGGAGGGAVGGLTATPAAMQQVNLGAMGGLTQMQQIALMQSAGQAGGAGVDATGAAQLMQNQVMQNQVLQNQIMQNQMIMQNQAVMNASKGPSQAEQALNILKAAGTTTTMPQQQIATPMQTPDQGTGVASPEYQQAMQILSDCASTGRVAEDAEIVWLIGVREKLRYKKEFTVADDLRIALRNTLSIELYEKEKRWAMADGRQGLIPMFSDLA
jgi:cysteinyl-tRNA synthetase